MQDPRLDRLAGILLGHSLQLEKGHIVQINASICAQPLVAALYRRAAELGLYLVVRWQDEQINRLHYDLLDPAEPFAARYLQLSGQWDADRIRDIQGFITIRASENDQELSGVDKARQQWVAKAGEAVSHTIINERQWMLFNWPTAAQAQKAGLPTEVWFDRVLDVCLLDYDRLLQAEEILADYLRQADQVRIIAPGTDLSFSIKGMPAVCCCGRRNVPDGEVYTAPILDSVQGRITYNVPSNYWGKTFNRIAFTFRDGVIVEATCDGDTALLNRILDTDPGGRRIGEFSFGVNPLIRDPMGSTLFDEKITGSIHFTPGNAYARADNGNKSAIHWDLIQIQRPEQGGGEIWLDGQLIRQDGLFVPSSLQALNPDNLLAAGS